MGSTDQAKLQPAPAAAPHAMPQTAPQTALNSKLATNKDGTAPAMHTIGPTAGTATARGGYLRYEVLRTFRNRRLLVFSLVFPFVLFVTIASENRHAVLDGIPFPVYYMAGMASWGALLAIISSGGRIAGERQIGWTRQIRVTPLRAGSYLRAKLLCSYLLALLSIAVLYLAGTVEGVRLDAGQWVEMTGLMLVGLIPFAVLGIVLGHLLTPDTAGPAIGGITTLFALLGGSWGPLFRAGFGLDVMKGVPSYWLVQAGHTAFGNGGWPPAEMWIVVAAWTAVLVAAGARAWLRDTARV